jgi:hypothetical protein
MRKRRIRAVIECRRALQDFEGVDNVSADTYILASQTGFSILLERWYVKKSVFVNCTNKKNTGSRIRHIVKSRSADDANDSEMKMEVEVLVNGSDAWVDSSNLF